MIFVSSSCVVSKTIGESVLALANEGFVNIELSGGTEYYNDYLDDLFDLKRKYSLQYLVHNYFPPPEDHFMLNLASLDNDLYNSSIKHYKNAITLCKRIGSLKYGIHAGFLMDFSPEEAGDVIGVKSLNIKKKALNRFCCAWDILTKYAGGDVKLYIENNVFSHSNKLSFNNLNPFLFVDYDGYLEMSETIDFNIILDLAHLKVSSNSLNLSLDEQVKKMLPLTDYYHLSENDGLHDQNNGLDTDCSMSNIIELFDLSQDTVTLEVYSGMSELKNSFNILYDKMVHT